MRFWLLIGVVWATLAVLCPAPLWAGDLAFAPEQEPGAGADKEHGEKKGGHAKEKGHAVDEHSEDSLTNIQKGLFKGSIDLALWSIVVFLVLMFVLGKFAWPHIAEGLER